MPDKLEQAELFQIIINNLPVGYSVVNREGLIVEFNAAAEKITGFNRNEVLGTPHYELLHGTTDSHACPLFNHVFETRQGSVNTETEIIRKDGSKIDISVTTTPLLDGEGNFYGGAEFFRDISSIKKLQLERKNILSMFAHDMKSPLVVSQGFIKRILNTGHGQLNEKQQKYLLIISSNLKNLEQLITGFLDFSRLEQQECILIFKEIDLVQLIKKIFANLTIAAEKNHVEFRFEVNDQNGYPAQADPLMLERALTNIIANAVKYSTPKSTVTVSLSRKDTSFLISIADTGRGIPQENLALIFEPFYRGEKSDSKGFGLGLAIAKTILAGHSGSIEVESCPGKGSTFFVELPQNANLKPKP